MIPIIDEIYLSPEYMDPSAYIRGNIAWYDEWLKNHRQLRTSYAHGEVKNLRDLRRHWMKQEVRYGLRPAKPGASDRITRPTS